MGHSRSEPAGRGRETALPMQAGAGDSCRRRDCPPGASPAARQAGRLRPGGLRAALFALLLAPPFVSGVSAQDEYTEVWNTTMTAGAGTLESETTDNAQPHVGYVSGRFGTLPDRTFTFDGESYTIREIAVATWIPSAHGQRRWAFYLAFDRSLLLHRRAHGNLVFRAGGFEVRLSDVAPHVSEISSSWSLYRYYAWGTSSQADVFGVTDLNWSDGESIDVSLVAPNRPLFNPFAHHLVLSEDPPRYAGDSRRARDVRPSVEAIHPGGETVRYTLEGRDAALFTINENTGQIRTKADGVYDYETETRSCTQYYHQGPRRLSPCYEATVRATASGATTATGGVTIELLDGLDGPAMTGTFQNVPRNHNSPFTFEVHFSEEVVVSAETLRDHAFAVTNGEVTGARQLNPPSTMAWEITVAAFSEEAVTLVLPETTDCAAAGAICTEDGRKLSAEISAVVEGPGATPEPLTATFGDVPSEHTGQAFTFGLGFSEELADDFSYKTLRDDAFEVTGGSVTTASRTAPPSNREWNITVEPASSSDAVTITLPKTTDCGATGAICTGGDDPKRLSNSPSHTVAGAGAANTPATGAPTISGTARVGETLTASVSGIADADGLAGASFAYQWIRGSTGIQGATGSSYTLAGADEGARIKVRVSFTDDAGHAESLTSAATGTVEGVAAVPDPLTATFGDDMPASHTGEQFTFGLAFSEELADDFSYKTLRDDAFEVTGGSVKKASRQTQGSNLAWNITVEPASSSDTVAIALPKTTDCGATGAICTEDGRKLSHPLSATVVDAASAGDAANGDNGDAADDALALAAGVTPDEAAAMLLGEGDLSEAQLGALDQLGNGNGRYDLGDLLSWIARCRRGEARCGGTSTDAGPASSAALLAAAAAGHRGMSRRRRRHDSGRRGRGPVRAKRRRARRGRIRARHAARRHDLVLRRRFGGAGRHRGGPGLPNRRMDGSGSQSRHRRSAGAGRSRHRNRAGSRARVVPIRSARAASDHRGGLAAGGSPRAVPGAGPQPAPPVPGPRPSGHGRGLRAEGQRGVPGRDHALTTLGRDGPPTMRAAARVRRGARGHSSPDARRSCSDQPARGFSGERAHDGPDGLRLAGGARTEANHDRRSRNPAARRQPLPADVEPLGLGRLHGALRQGLHGFSPRVAHRPADMAPSSPEPPSRPAARCPVPAGPEICHTEWTIPNRPYPTSTFRSGSIPLAGLPDEPPCPMGISTPCKSLGHCPRVDVLANGSSRLRAWRRWSSSSPRG